jgi:hypothetical protein
MNVDDINKTKIHSNIDKLIDLLECAIEEKSAYYVSIPMTSGKRFIDWYKKEGTYYKNKGDNVYRQEHYKSVLSKNIKNSSTKIKKIKKEINGIIIEPTKLNMDEWEQDEYRYYWGKIIEKYIKKSIFFDGWQYSNGCSFEFLKSMSCNLICLDERLNKITLKKAIALLTESIKELNECLIDTEYLEKIKNGLFHHKKYSISNALTEKNLSINYYLSSDNSDLVYKDQILDNVAWTGNVAQFVSFRPTNNSQFKQKFCRISGFSPNHQFLSPKIAIEKLLEKAIDGTVNIRSYKPNISKGLPFKYGISNVQDVLDILNDFSDRGLFTIVNETIDINDGGVSGVLIDDLIEFSPGDTPKCVDKPGICRLNRENGIEILNIVYGFRPKISISPEFRVEFSIHPKRRGYLREHTIIWELEHVGKINNAFEITWPNNFSKFLGDKIFGLLIADSFNIPVPKTFVISKNVAPFSFGQNTGTNEVWIRTCPEEPEPGYYPTEFGWTDPFKLMDESIKKNDKRKIYSPIMSIISQESVEPLWSGALISQKDNESPIIEGSEGKGDKFMIGENKNILPNNVVNAVKKLYKNIFKKIGHISLEWVYDGKQAWCVQLHKKSTNFGSDVIYSNSKNKIDYIEYKVSDGLNGLRELINSLKFKAEGILLVGDVGITSHFGDLLRKSKIPSKIKRGP